MNNKREPHERATSLLLDDYDQAIRLQARVQGLHALSHELREEAGAVFKHGSQDTRAIFLRDMADRLMAKARQLEEQNIGLDEITAMYEELCSRQATTDQAEGDES